MVPQEDAMTTVEEKTVEIEIGAGGALPLPRVGDHGEPAVGVQVVTSLKRSRRTSTSDKSSQAATKKCRFSEDGDNDDDIPGAVAAPSDNDAKKQKDTEDDMAWICAECKEAECLMEPSADEFLLCDGPCNRVFHYPCAGLSKIPDSDQDWICKDCNQARHQCAFCQQYGQDQVDVFSCQKDKCGLFFHESCLALNNVPVKMEQVVKRSPTAGTRASRSGSGAGGTCTPRNTQDDPLGFDNGTSTSSTSVPVFICPAHHCWTCTQEDALAKEQEEAAAAKKNTMGKKKKRGGKPKQSSIYQCKTEGRIYRCLYCPWAYHATCLPPTCKFHELAVLCPEHSMTQKLPDLDLSTSLQGTVEEKIEQKIEKLGGQSRARRSLLSGFGGRGGGASSNPFFPGIRGDRLLAAEQRYMQYLTQVKVENDEHSDAVDGVVATTLAAINASTVGGLAFCLPTDIKNEVHAQPPIYTHLHGLRYDPNYRPKRIRPTGEQCQCVDSCGDHCFNRMTLVECSGEGATSNCRLGAEKCGNRSLGKRLFVKCKPKRESGKGWGLVPMEDIPQGNLVQEYVGEVINEKEKERRLIEWNKDHPNDPNFYMMGLGVGWYLDAREFANMSRFINHSCDPNCQVTTINVKGYKRNGIFALRDIKAGEFLCYDYHFDTKQADRFLCRCGAKNCRGTMQGGGGSSETKRPLNWKEAKSRYENDMKQLAQLNSMQVTSQVGPLIPAADQPTEYISSGPLEKHRDTAISNGIFLWRNAKRGSDFVARNARVETCKSNPRASFKPPRNEKTPPDK